MSKVYDIHNTSKRKWKMSITLHLSEGYKGYSYYNLKPGGVLENVTEDKISNQIRSLTKAKRGRPPVIELKEVDAAAREAVAAREAKVRQDRAAKKARKQSTEYNVDVEAIAETVSEMNLELSDEEMRALESGGDLPDNAD